MSKFSHFYFNVFLFWLYIYQKHSMKGFRFVVFLSILSVQFSCSSENDGNSNNSSDQIITLSGKQQRDTVFLSFIIPEKIIRAQRTGKLERLVETPEFKKNSLLVQFDNYDAFVGLSGEKEALREDLTNQLDNLPESLQPIEKKWRDFASKLTPDKMTPAFPSMEYKEESAFIEEAGIVEKYQAIQKKELAVQNYFQLSKEDGFITKVYAHTDDYVTKNKPLIAYHPRKIKATAESAFPLSKSITRQIKSNFVVRLPVDSVKIIKRSTTKINYSLFLHQAINQKNCPRYFIIMLDKNVFHVPKEYVGKDRKVIVSGEKEQLQAYHKNGEYLIYSKKPVLKVQKV